MKQFHMVYSEYVRDSSASRIRPDKQIPTYLHSALHSSHTAVYSVCTENVVVCTIFNFHTTNFKKIIITKMKKEWRRNFSYTRFFFLYIRNIMFIEPWTWLYNMLARGLWNKVFLLLYSLFAFVWWLLLCFFAFFIFGCMWDPYERQMNEWEYKNDISHFYNMINWA